MLGVIIMFLFSRRKRIIKKAVDNTVKALGSRTPKIFEHFFYGAFDIAPQNLVVWYLFETDEELEIAKSSGFCAELKELTIKNLISLGYPKEAVDSTKIDVKEFNEDRIKIEGGSEEDAQRIFDALSNRKVMVSFTTREDIDRKTNGDYRLYFQ